MTEYAPAITVLMPAHNAGKYIGEAIDSVLSQSFTDFELLIVNDGSTDETEALIEAYTDTRIVLIRQKKQGIAAALNRGLSHARAAYIARFDADDICHPDRLRIQYEFAVAHPDYSVIGSAAEYIDAGGQYMFRMPLAAEKHEDLQRLHYSVCPFIHSTVMYKKEVVRNAGGYNGHAYTFEDHLLWRSVLKTEKTCNIPLPLINVRLNPESFTMDEKWRPRRFLEIKDDALRTGEIPTEDAAMLAEMSGHLVSRKWKQAAYHALCGKKYLFNNYQPGKARLNTWKAIRFTPLRLDNYVFLLMSFSPQPFIHWLYNKSVSGGKIK